MCSDAHSITISLIVCTQIHKIKIKTLKEMPVPKCNNKSVNK